LCRRRFDVACLARPRSIAKVPQGCRAVAADVLDARTYKHAVPAGSTFVHLVGVPHPAPWKGEAFRAVDLVSLQQSVAAAVEAGVAHFVYVGVAHPAPVMKAFIEVRVACEEIIRRSGLPATILRPWYVLGPGHYWPYALLPFYVVLEALPATRAGAVRLGLVRRAEMIAALAGAVETGPRGLRILEPVDIRALR
jgi:uncharacterized protein YbjT (DUF2867 family)